MRTAMIVGTVLALSVCAANADPLPNIYLGRWCTTYGKQYSVATKEEWDMCHTSDGYLEIKRNGWERHEEKCRFISVRHTGEKTPDGAMGAATKPRKEDLIPIVRLTARCFGTGDVWRSHVILTYRKGGYISFDSD